MSAVLKPKSKAIVCDGNEAAAWAVTLARVDMVAVYPITPQSSLVEYLAKFVADGKLNAEIVDVEGEHSVLSVLHGWRARGRAHLHRPAAPVSPSCSSPYLRTPGLRMPMVMSIVTRDTLTPQSVWGGHQDAMSVREVGWIQMYCETVQEVLDTTIMGYKVAEHRDVMLPVNVCHDGNYLSYGATRVELPSQEEVDAFLPPPATNWHAALDPDRPMAVDPLTPAGRARRCSCATARASARACRMRWPPSRPRTRTGRASSAAATRRWWKATAWTTRKSRWSPSAP
jgi:pyruvate ferredoxin oxidoreductase alpha subunit/phenylglyoxylate dehydrogenase alpha subunit